MAETIISAIILLISIAPLIIIGIAQYRSKSPVGFWSGKKPPEKEQIRDIPAYNHKHGIMWILYGTGFILCFLVGIPLGGEAAAILVIVECFGGLAAMIAYHNRLNRRYFIRENEKA